MRVLVLGGTTEATRLAARLAGHPTIRATVSLAGRTAEPAPQPIPMRIGGFGGVDGLVAWCQAEGIQAIVVATHPFAARIGWNAAEAARQLAIPAFTLTRPAWTPVEGDRWTEVADLDEAATALGAKPRRVMLTTGRLGLAAFAAAPHHWYLIRSIDPPEPVALPQSEVILDRPPFDLAHELDLMKRHGIEVVVSKNAGGKATSAKIAAARTLGLPVVMVRRPPQPDLPSYKDVDALVAKLQAHGRAPALRGV